METLHRYYIIADTIVKAEPHMDRSDYEYSVMSSTLHGAQEFLKMVQRYRQQNPGTNL